MAYLHRLTSDQENKPVVAFFAAFSPIAKGSGGTITERRATSNKW